MATLPPGGSALDLACAPDAPARRSFGLPSAATGDRRANFFYRNDLV